MISIVIVLIEFDGELHFKPLLRISFNCLKNDNKKIIEYSSISTYNDMILDTCKNTINLDNIKNTNSLIEVQELYK